MLLEILALWFHSYQHILFETWTDNIRSKWGKVDSADQKPSILLTASVKGNEIDAS